MKRRPPVTTRTDTLCPYPTLFRSTGAQMAAMIVDSGARHLFLDAPAAANIEGQAVTAGDRIAMDGSDAGAPLDDWMAPAGTEIGRAHVSTPVTNAHLVCRLLLEKQKDYAPQLPTVHRRLQLH